MNQTSVMFRIPKTVCWGYFLAGSIAAFAQTPSLTVAPQSSLVPQGVEFSILGSIPGDQVWPSLSLLPSGGVIACQDNVVDKNGSGIRGALFDTSFNAGRNFGVNKTATGNQMNPKVQLLADNNIIAVWQCNVAGTPGVYARMARGTTTKT